MNRSDTDYLPCMQETTDPETGKKIWRMPPVNCSLHCEKCGWNPEVKRRRIQKMQDELDGKRRTT